jgi:plasmid stabilization system protein ParE
VRWAEAALEDLEQTAAYIARDSRLYAAAFVREVRAAARSLALLPMRGRVVPEVGAPQVREIFIKKYRLIYRVGDDAVDVIGLIHGARDLGALFDREGR